MKMVRGQVRLVALALTLIGATASGEDGNTATELDLARHLILPVFDLLDCTAQGYVEAGEVDEHFPNLFGYHDHDRNSALSKDEYVNTDDPAKGRLDALLFARMDKDDDGSVTTFEYRSEVMNIITSMDKNGDGETSLEELQPVD